MELHCATGFEELDQALRQSLSKEVSPEQLTALLQGTAGLYQDLRMEIKKRMRVFEEYALAEILRLPPGLLAHPVVEGGGDVLENQDVTDEEERAIDEEMKALQLEISERKQRGRDVRATMQYLEMLVKDVKEKMSELETVPNVLGSTQTLERDVEYVTRTGEKVEEGIGRLEALQALQAGEAGAAGASGGVDEVDETMVKVMTARGAEGVDAEGVDADVQAHVSAAKQADAADLRAFRESLLSKK